MSATREASARRGREIGTPEPQSCANRLAAGTVLGFDYGERRIGVAIGELAIGVARPLDTITATSDAQRLAGVDRLVREWAPVLFVIGLPAHGDGAEHAFAARSRRFARRLEARFGVPARLIDERFTSVAASAALAERGVHGRPQKPLLDSVAAQHILNAFFASRDDAA
jgi:putative Holliday junction resolvase